jgi:hypothetical protein
MVLLTAFVITIVIGDLIAIGIASIVEYFSETISLLVFLVMFWGIIPLAWRFAVRVTAPKDAVAKPSQ